MTEPHRGPPWSPAGPHREGWVHTLPGQTQAGPTQHCLLNKYQWQVSLPFPTHEALPGSSTLGPKPYPACTGLQGPQTHRSHGFPRLDLTLESIWPRVRQTFGRQRREGAEWDWLPAGTHKLASPAQAHGHVGSLLGPMPGSDLSPPHTLPLTLKHTHRRHTISKYYRKGNLATASPCHQIPGLPTSQN